MPWSRRRNWVTKSSVNSKVFANLLRASMLVVSTENSPGCTPETLQKFTAYAVALDVERGWGEELAKNLLEMLRFDEAYGAGVWPRSVAERMPRTPQTYPPENGILELGISSRKILE